MQARARRDQARSLRANDPAVARELGIGLDLGLDLGRGYDDGGPVDLNTAPAGSSPRCGGGPPCSPTGSSPREPARAASSTALGKCSSMSRFRRRGGELHERAVFRGPLSLGFPARPSCMQTKTLNLGAAAAEVARSGRRLRDEQPCDPTPC